MLRKEHHVDFCVVGGGMSGLCAAVAAARRGIKVAIMQDRPMFGGNASSEVRMWICGANGEFDRETGIVEECMLENYHRNLNQNFHIWDTVLYEKVRFEENITMLMNCACSSVEMDGNKIVSVTGYQTTTETHHTVRATYFADCSGDSVLAPLTGAEFRVGREANAEFNETIGPKVADKKTMGMSCLFQIRETDAPKKFVAPKWAYVYEDDDALANRPHDHITNYWWIELGGENDSIHDTEELRDELLKIAYGVWDHMKNRGDHGVENWEMDWIGILPGKRESRRYMGDYILNENDVLAQGRFDDVVAYGGWTMDDHTPGGFNDKGNPNVFHPAPSPFGIPYRCLYSKNIENLYFAGRNISTTHAALSATRVMATCAVIGQAVGTAAALAVNDGKAIREIDVHKLQQQLLYDDHWIPFVERKRSELTMKANVNHPIVREGMDRDYADERHGYEGKQGDTIEFAYDAPEKISEIRIIFDSNLPRKYDNMPHNRPLKMNKYFLPYEMMKSYDLIAETPNGEVVLASVTDNCQRMVKHSVDVTATKIKLILKETWGSEVYKVYAMDIN